MTIQNKMKHYRLIQNQPVLSIIYRKGGGGALMVSLGDSLTRNSRRNGAGQCSNGGNGNLLVGVLFAAGLACCHHVGLQQRAFQVDVVVSQCLVLERQHLHNKSNIKVGWNSSAWKCLLQHINLYTNSNLYCPSVCLLKQKSKSCGPTDNNHPLLPSFPKNTNYPPPQKTPKLKKIHKKRERNHLTLYKKRERNHQTLHTHTQKSQES